MKTTLLKTIVALAGFIFLAGQSLNANSYTGTPSLKDVSKTISTNLHFPAELKKAGAEEKVSVVFTVDSTGQVNLAIAGTDNTILKQSIEQQFSKLTLAGLKPNNAYSVILNFKIM